jgi:hypothetical protein
MMAIQPTQPRQQARDRTYITVTEDYSPKREGWWLAQLWKCRGAGIAPLPLAHGWGDTEQEAREELDRKRRDNADWLERF